MSTKSRVQITSKLTAVSSRPIGSVKAHPFTSLDRAMGRHSVHVVFYYKANVFNDFDVDPIRVSLSETLSLYPPVTGRVVQDKEGQWQVSCNDTGVRIVRARVGASLDEWLRSADGVEEKDLTAREDMPDDPTNWSPFRIQLNEFEEGGVAIGISCPHMHADLTSATLLVKSWTDTHRNRPLSHPPLFSSFVDTPPLSDPIQTHHSSSKPCDQKTATATFKFSHSMVKNLLSEISANHCPAATPFDLLAALFWTRITQVEKKGKGNCTTLSICTDARTTTKELGYLYGNALRFSKVELESCCSDDLGSVTRLVHEGGVMGAGGVYGPELTCVSMEHMACSGSAETMPVMYSAGFSDEAKPVHVSYNVGNFEGEGLIVVSPSPGGEMARAVTVSLPLKEMGELCEDEAILRLEPIMVLSGGKSTY